MEDRASAFAIAYPLSSSRCDFVSFAFMLSAVLFGKGSEHRPLSAFDEPGSIRASNSSNRMEIRGSQAATQASCYNSLMPELPDILAYIDALETKILNQPIQEIRLTSPFLLRSFDPPLQEAVGKKVIGFRRLGKRIVFVLENDLFLVIHLMIAGRFHWKDKPSKPNKQTLAMFLFPSGTLVLTEAGSKKRASMHVVRGEVALTAHNPGGLEVFDSDEASFRAALTR